MALYTKESLERLKEKLDLVELFSSYIDLKKQGSVYKALCPFHEEKTPSLMIKSGATSYHCFGCGAHGDAIEFLMSHLHLSFTDAIEMLAERYHVVLDKVDKEEKEGVSKQEIREALFHASLFYHCYLLHSKEGVEPLRYLLKRSISMGNISRFEIGLAPKERGVFKAVMREKKISDAVLRAAGLLQKERDADFFWDRITFPIRDKNGYVIGFSARKFKEETSGGKYINSYETALFKKSKILFGINYAFPKIVKEKKVYIVEGQIDCLKMIEAGFDKTLSTLGTALGEEHVNELQKLGLREALLLFDGDAAGRGAASKAGNVFQKKGVDVKIALLPKGFDPDSFLRAEGVEKLQKLIDNPKEYIAFQIEWLAQTYDLNTPAGKNEMVTTLFKQIKEWEEPVMVYESLKKVAKLTHIPEEILGITGIAKASVPLRGNNLLMEEVDANKVLEFDLLRWLLLLGSEKKEVVELISKNLTIDHFSLPFSRKLFESYMQKNEEERDLLSLMIDINDKESSFYLEEILNKKINKERFLEQLTLTIQKLLERQWMKKRERIAKQIESNTLSEKEMLHLMQEFDLLKKQRPTVIAR